MLLWRLEDVPQEELVLTATTGASNDIEQATAYKKYLITMYGMFQKSLVWMALETVETRDFWMDPEDKGNCADATAAQIGSGSRKKTLKKCYEQAKNA